MKEKVILMPALPGIQLFDLTDRKAIVTGGSKGLGFAMAAGLCSAGADVFLTSRHEKEACAAAEKLSTEYDRDVIGMKADVTSQSDIDAMIDCAIQRWGQIDILINNAGINIRGAIEELTLEEFRQVQSINVEGMWLCCQAALPHLKQSRSPRIINLGSTLGLVGLQNRTPYASSKGAVVQMTRALGLELANTGVTVNAICPGPFLTEMNIPIAESDEAKTFIIGAVALNRWGRMEEIQGAAIFLASDASSYMTGSLLTVDGGWTAR